MFPDYLDGAKVLLYTEAGHFGFITDYDAAGNSFEQEICQLAICAYPGDPACRLFLCDQNYQIIAINCCRTMADCRHTFPRAVWLEKHPPYFYTAAQRKIRGGSCYFEFQRGRYQDQHWLARSIYMDEELFAHLKLPELFCAALPHFDYYGTTEVTQAQYEVLKATAMKQGREIAEVFRELDKWVRDCFFTENIFTICGI